VRPGASSPASPVSSGRLLRSRLRVRLGFGFGSGAAAWLAPEPVSSVSVGSTTGATDGASASC
jgi:hypothetical protein